MDITFSADRENICLPIIEILLCAATGDLASSRNQQYCMPRNSILLPPFLMEAAILNRESDAGELLNIFSSSITE